MSEQYICGDMLDVLRSMDDQSVDLVFCSPPYEDARLYGELGFKIKGQKWVDWCVPRFQECVRVCRGLVAWVVEGKTRKFQYSCTPHLLVADLHRAGVCLRKPPVFHRVGIPGSGGPDWLRNDYESIICATNGGKLPWSDSTACGHQPKWAPGGEMSYRLADGSRRNQNDGEQMRVQCYSPPAKANPGNVLHFKVGGGLMGHAMAHDNEAPFPLGLAEFFVKSFCPPGGVVLDPFMGSGTTLHAAVIHGRSAIGIDIREGQVAISQDRIADVQSKMVVA